MIFGDINAWRSKAIFKPRFNSVLPGFLPAVGLFTAYVIIETIMDNKKDTHGENNHH
ncbi:hypothetical protein DDB_G0281033 [Dictyostelium discoideum AX4]|uniref:Uncharacterized protein n=1 Tax=Dictyostelium discoideum TaxID=44689 RepID=Q54UJ9_DICDI|nr:hypothetical protein DDB_G0281033 [Dictyostelium discoideum AX4]EAL66813.1 hypothetical protein DDB_G0281033 [Dictyostelium discoideum AX4]|eukprot:XP_640777.1 hypothetical protein DDB_G0281033 [Dictyostelium discoideum AX4]